jgi:hypothetical protein
MRIVSVVPIFLCLSLFPFGAPAQEAGPKQLVIGPSGEAYMASVRYSGVETDVGYYDPTNGIPKLDTSQQPPPPADPSPAAADESLNFRRAVTLLVIMMLVVVGLLILRNAGGISLSFQSDTQNPTRRRNSLVVPGASDAPPAELGAILAMADRRRALVILARAALARAVAAGGVLQQPSWTMRDMLRHIPKTHSHLEALRQLVLAGERVLYGNRDVTEADFQSQVAAIRPLLERPLP